MKGLHTFLEKGKRKTEEFKTQILRKMVPTRGKLLGWAVAPHMWGTTRPLAAKWSNEGVKRTRYRRSWGTYELLWLSGNKYWVKTFNWMHSIKTSRVSRIKADVWENLVGLSVSRTVYRKREEAPAVAHAHKWRPPLASHPLNFIFHQHCIKKSSGACQITVSQFRFLKIQSYSLKINGRKYIPLTVCRGLHVHTVFSEVHEILA